MRLGGEHSNTIHEDIMEVEAEDKSEGYKVCRTAMMPFVDLGPS